MNIHDPLMDDVSYAIYKEGCFECRHLTNMLAALARYQNPPAYLVDVGGNIGMWTLAAAAAGHEAFALEPYAPNYRRMCNSATRNGDGFHGRVHLFDVAATSKETTFRIDVPKRNKGGGRVSSVEDATPAVGGADDGNDNDNDIDDDEYTIHGVPVDSLRLPTDRPIVLKLDVEGHELPALEGMFRFLQRADVVYAMTELRPTFQRDGPKSYESWKRILGDVLAYSKGLVPYRIDGRDGEVETMLDVERLHEWKHEKHPNVRYFDVVWRKKRD